MAASGSTNIKVTNYNNLYFSWWIQSQDITKRTSTVQWELGLTATSHGQISSTAAKSYKVMVNGNTYSGSTTIGISNNSTKVLAFGTTVIPHNTDGTKTFSYNFTTFFGINFGGTYISDVSGSGSGTLNPIGMLAPTFTHAPNIDDEDTTFVVYFSNPNGSKYTSLQIGIFGGLLIDVPLRTITKTATEYRFNLTEAEMNALRASVIFGSSTEIQYILVATYDGEEYYSHANATYTLINHEPTLNPVVEDTNATTIALTGDKNKLIRYASNATFTANAVARKGATVAQQNCNNNFMAIPTETGTFTGTQSGSFRFWVKDSRGLQALTTVNKTLIEYFKPTCSLVSDTPSADDTNLTFSVSGEWFNKSFGVASNTLTVQYRYKTNNGSYSSWKTLTATKSGDTYTANGSISGISYTNTYTIQARATDKLFTVNSTDDQTVIKPIFDWSKDDFNFNVPVTIQGKEVTILVDSGTDSNGWYYRKWSDGTSECWVSKNFVVNVTNAWGNMYASGVISGSNVKFPSGLFISTPNIQASLQVRSVGGILMAPGGAGSNIASATQTGAYEIARGSSIGGAEFTINYHALGRWK